MGVADSPRQQEVGVTESLQQQKVGVADSSRQQEIGVTGSSIQQEMGVVEPSLQQEMDVPDFPLEQEMGVASTDGLDEEDNSGVTFSAEITNDSPTSSVATVTLVATETDEPGPPPTEDDSELASEPYPAENDRLASAWLPGQQVEGRNPSSDHLTCPALGTDIAMVTLVIFYL